jgi:Ni/Co efflux regulator RcnB
MLRSVILAVAAVAVVGTTLTSSANAGQFIGKFDMSNTPIPTHTMSAWQRWRQTRHRDEYVINHGLPCSNTLGNKCFPD